MQILCPLKSCSDQLASQHGKEARLYSSSEEFNFKQVACFVFRWPLTLPAICQTLVMNYLPCGKKMPVFKPFLLRLELLVG
jgi:hypothetical protein